PPVGDSAYMAQYADLRLVALRWHDVLHIPCRAMASCVPRSSRTTKVESLTWAFGTRCNVTARERWNAVRTKFFPRELRQAVRARVPTCGHVVTCLSITGRCSKKKAAGGTFVPFTS